MDLPPVTAREVAQYLRAHPANGVRAAGPVCLILDPSRRMVYVRWPNGRVAWETADSLRARGFPVPDRGLLQPRSA
jgi:hypothetical protein